VVPVLALLAICRVSVQAEDYSKVWNQVSTAISTSYYDRKKRKEDMDRLLAKYKPIASSASSRDEFEKAVNDMIQEFHDSHFAFLTPADQTFFVMDGLASSTPKPMPEFGAWFQKGQDGYTISMVLEGTSAAQAGLRKGDIVEKIDGSPFTPVKSLTGLAGKRVSLVVRRAGREIPIDVEVNSIPAMDMFLKASGDSQRVLDVNGRKVGYYHLWTQSGDKFKNSLSGAVYGSLANTDAMILDLRDGFGGRPEGYADPFFRPDLRIVWDTAGNKLNELFGYQRPLVVLINQGSRSAKEVLSYILKKSKRAKLIGLTTAGHVLGTFPMKINDWAYLEIPMVDVITDGFRIEGVGVSPDIAVPREFDDSGKDLVLERALQELKNVKVGDHSQPQPR